MFPLKKDFDCEDVLEIILVYFFYKKAGKSKFKYLKANFSILNVLLVLNANLFKEYPFFY